MQSPLMHLQMARIGPRHAEPPLIIGGGPAGAAAATLIAAAGRPVTLVERNAGPTDKLCGDFLSGAALAALHALGLDPEAMGAAPVRTIRLVHRRTSAESASALPRHGPVPPQPRRGAAAPGRTARRHDPARPDRARTGALARPASPRGPRPPGRFPPTRCFSPPASTICATSAARPGLTGCSG